MIAGKTPSEIPPTGSAHGAPSNLGQIGLFDLGASRCREKTRASNVLLWQGPQATRDVLVD